MHFKVYSGYYYTRLNELEKKAYKKLLDGLYEYNNVIKINEKISYDSVEHILMSLRMDVPEFFYVDFTQVNIMTTYSYVKVTFNFLVHPQIAENMKNKLFVAVEEAKKYLSTSPNPQRAIHDYLAYNVKYDKSFSSPYIYDIYGALVQRSCVCEGYAKAFKLLCDEARIPCLVVVGESMREKHAWNIVRIRDVCYHVDTTWNSSLLECADIPVYYNVSDKFMGMDHYWNKDDYPSCNISGEIEREIIDVVGMASFADSLENMIRLRKDAFILRFNRKFSSGDEISFLLEKIVSKRNVKGISGWGITYLEKLDCAVVKVDYSRFFM